MKEINNMSPKKTIHAINKFISDFIDGDFFGLAAQISFYLLSTFFPMALMVFTAASAISLNYTDAMFKVLALLPNKAETLITSMLVSHRESAMVIASTAVVSLSTMSGLILTAEKALIRFYQIENTRSFWMSWIMSIFFAVLIFISLIAIFSLIIFGRIIGTAISTYINYPQAITLWNISRFAVIIIFIAFVVSALYKTLPTIKLKLWDVLPGALITTVAWYAASMLFALYVNNFPQYEIIYGSLAGFVCMIMWIYMTGVILLAGAKINALVYRRKIKKIKFNEKNEFQN